MSNIGNYKSFRKINEQEEEEELPFRLYGDGETPESQLITEFEDLIKLINTSNPKTTEDFEAIKESIIEKKNKLKSHPNYAEFKESGFEWQDDIITIDKFSEDLKSAVINFHDKAEKNGLL